jgi:1,2-diacylglycerol 3-beta-galactosyltransferase
MRLLFLFSDTGGGHRSAASAVRDFLQAQETDTPQIALIDIFKALPWPFPHVPALWPTMIKLHGLPWALFYHLTDHRKIVACMARAVWPVIAPSLKKILTAHPADAIASFHPLANDVLSLAHHTFGDLPPMMSISQDLVNVHAATFAPGFVCHTVPTVEARERALRCDVDPAQLHVTGVPTRSRFTELMDLPQSVARARLGLPTNEPLILLIGGSDGSGPLIRVVRAVACQTQNAAPALVAVAGHNQPLIRQLRTLDVPSLQVKGFVPELALWMRAADVLVTKAGPNTLAEAFITGCPIVLYHAIPGQENGNVRYVVDHDAGFWRPHPTRAAESTQILLADPARREVMSSHAQALARPRATEQIARLVKALAG